ncbi:bifunctional nuclease domain-containing protein [uncultured Bacteroides sp.]|uniref:bifunctional nuclease family protein n=1 Tax=uncultured Bacteroides sp. TaxID=162156 RepID=UPI002AA639B3|nr:bifunctional nuclease domain-containing protein [uncultured Bacteroides sp.]
MKKKVELKVLNVSNSQAQACAYAMILGEVNGKRQLPIIIGSTEAQAIVLKLKGIESPRPLSHDFIETCLNEFSINVSEVLIYKAQEGIFYSYVYLKKEDKTIEIDSRTSDAVALAIRFKCPIYIYESILEKEAMAVDEESKEEEDMEEENLQSLKESLAKAIKEENYELASIIRDKISHLQ